MGTQKVISAGMHNSPPSWFLLLTSAGENIIWIPLGLSVPRSMDGRPHGITMKVTTEKTGTKDSLRSPKEKMCRMALPTS